MTLCGRWWLLAWTALLLPLAACGARGVHAGEDPPAGYKREPGPAAVVEELATWTDAARRREVPVKVYAPKDGPGPFPVIIFSHGLGGSREGYAYLGRHWASYGYVAVHLQHQGSDTAVLLEGPAEMLKAATSPEVWRTRPQDVSFAITQLAAVNREHPLWKGRLDLERVGVAGHSYGAYTTLAVIGQGDTGLRDPRVKAAIAMSAPAGRGLLSADRAYGRITTPCLHMTGTKDDTAFFGTLAAERRIPFDKSPGPDAFLITLKDAEHLAFSDNELFPGLGQTKRIPAHHDYIRMATTAFLDAFLKGDAQARAWLLDGGFQKVAGDGATLEKKPARAKEAK